MADHYYSPSDLGSSVHMDRGKVTVDTSTTAGSKIEVRVTDGGVTRQQLYLFLEEMASFVAASDAGVIVAGTLLQS